MCPGLVGSFSYWYIYHWRLKCESELAGMLDTLVWSPAPHEENKIGQFSLNL